MCGIVGLYGPAREGLESLLERMTDRLRHRGPDDQGLWVDPARGLGLGHRRLSVLELSPLGHQPMVSRSGRLRVVYNGEIYNFRELRQELGEGRFRGHSDTEVLLEAVEQWGLEGAVERFRGMFALALWDEERGQLALVRDRLGKKPLFYCQLGATLVFASELKALRAHPDFSGRIDPDALAFYLRFAYTPADQSIYQGVRKLPPGHILRYPGEPRRYWICRPAPVPAAREEARRQLHDLLRESVRLRLQSDAPLGAFLSGGIDSSLVVALAQEQKGGPLETFSIGFGEPDQDEAPWARAVATHLRSTHHEHYVRAEEALEVARRLPELMDEPFGDSSAIPTYIVSRLARSRVTVALSGDGGDEVFFGYPRYLRALRVWSVLSQVPFFLRKLVAGCLGSSGLAAKLRSRSLTELYHETMSCRPLLLPERSGGPAANSPLDLSLADLRGYLPDDILVKVDRASMAVSLEARAPLLDHRVVEYGLGLPLPWKVRGGDQKWLLQEILADYLPERMFRRPKRGFSIPRAHWLRTRLRGWAEELLDPAHLRYLDPQPVQRLWRQHLAGRNHELVLWNVLMLQQWSRSC